MMPDCLRPMNAMKSPIPAVIPYFKLSGMASISCFLRDVNDKIIKSKPVTNTALNAVW